MLLYLFITFRTWLIDDSKNRKKTNYLKYELEPNLRIGFNKNISTKWLPLTSIT